MQPVRKGPESVGIFGRVNFPGARVPPALPFPVVRTAGNREPSIIAACITPTEVQLDPGIKHPLHRGSVLERPARMLVRHDGRWLTGNAWQVVSDEPAPPKILGSHNIRALPKHQGNQRGADLLARLQVEFCEFLACLDGQTGGTVPGKCAGPLSRPAHRHDHAFAGHLQIEVRPARRAIRGFARAGRAEFSDVMGDELEPIGREAFSDIPVTLDSGERKFPLLAALERGVQPLNIPQDERICIPGVLEIYRPLHGGIIIIANRHAPDLKSALRILPDDTAQRAGVVNFPTCYRFWPVGKQALRQLIVVNK